MPRALRGREKTVPNTDPLTRAEMEEGRLLTLDRHSRQTRPRTRGECSDGPRPCPWASCRYHLFVDIKEGSGALILNHKGRDIDELDESCSLDVADRGGVTLDRIGQLMGVSMERARQLETDASEAAFVAVARLRRKPLPVREAMPATAALTPAAQKGPCRTRVRRPVPPGRPAAQSKAGRILAILEKQPGGVRCIDIAREVYGDDRRGITKARGLLTWLKQGGLVRQQGLGGHWFADGAPPEPPPMPAGAPLELPAQLTVTTREKENEMTNETETTKKAEAETPREPVRRRGAKKRRRYKRRLVKETVSGEAAPVAPRAPAPARHEKLIEMQRQITRLRARAERAEAIVEINRQLAILARPGPGEETTG